MGPPQPAADRQTTEGVDAMKQFSKCVVTFMKREDGPTAVEYAVMLALIIVVCIAAIQALGNAANGTFTTVGNTIGAAAS
jgi:pilus assembly protein Flp/PilA